MVEGKCGIVCFGRGIERVRAHGEGYVWQPTAYLEKMTPDRQHGGYRTDGLTLASKDEDVVVAGAYANVLAVSHYFLDSVTDAEVPSLLAWAAGRPQYLSCEPAEVSEGSVLFEEFKMLIGGDPKTIVPDLRVEFQTQNKNTRDDLLQSLFIAKEMGLRRLCIVSVLVHLRRIAEFYHAALEAEGSLAGIEVRFLASELVLLNRGYAADILLCADPEIAWFDHLALAKILESPVYRRTAAREEKGVADLRSGKYNFVHQGYQFSK